MKAQLLVIVLLFSLISTFAVAQERSQSNKPVLPEHPLMKLLSTLEEGTEQQQFFKSSNNAYQLDSVEQQVWGNADSWVSYLRTENIYEAGKRVESNVYFQPEPGNWEQSSSEVYTYEDNLLTSIVLYGVSENEPISGERTLISYQTSGGMTLPQTTVYQYWDDTWEEWVNMDRTTLRVENGIIVGGSYDEWDIDTWLETDRFTLEEINGDLVETTLIYDGFIDEWVNYERVIYSDLTAADLYDRFEDFLDQVDDGSLLYLLTFLPDYTSYEWIEDGGSSSWIAINRQISNPSNELEFGAASAVRIYMEFNAVEANEWMSAYEVLVGYSDTNLPVGMSFFSMSDETESASMEKIFSEHYNYINDDLLAVVLKYGSWDNFVFSKSNSEEQANGRAVLNWSDVVTSIDPKEQPLKFRLNPAYPNPFNPSTIIPFQTSAASEVTIQVFDMLGRSVATLVDGFMPAGNHTVQFDASGLSSGMYLVRLNAPGNSQTRAITLIK